MDIIDMKKMAASLGTLSKELSSPSISNFFKRMSLKRSIKSAVKRSDMNVNNLSKESLSPETSKKILSNLKNRAKREKALNSL